MTKPIIKECKWYSVDDKLPEIITEWRKMLVYTDYAGVDVGYWHQRTKKFLDEPRGFEYKFVKRWAEMTKLSPV